MNQRKSNAPARPILAHERVRHWCAQTLQPKRVTIAPLDYKPTLPKVLQPKTPVARLPVMPKLSGHLVAPVFRPEKNNFIQPKAIGQPSRQPAAPPVYRPQPTPKVLQRKTDPLRSRPAAPPVYRPQTIPAVLQRKMDAGQQPPDARADRRPIGSAAGSSVAKPAFPHPGAPQVYRSHQSPEILRSRGTVGWQLQLVQMTQDAAIAYSKKHNLELELEKQRRYKKIVYTISKATVEAFINDQNNERQFRIGLLRAYNQDLKNPKHKIKFPDDLKPSKTMTFSPTQDFTEEYDSDDDDGTKIDEAIEKSKLGELTLYRPSLGTEEKAPILSMPKLIRIGRQIVKTGDYEQYLPLVAKINDYFLEFKHPGSKDVYCTPLERESKRSKRYRRGGTSSQFNWKNLSTNLDNESDTSKERLAKRKRIFGFFKGEMYNNMTSSEIEAIGAVSCDYLKGSGNKTYVKRVHGLRDNGDLKFRELFSDLYYTPAITGGRGYVVEETKRLKLLKRKRED